MVLLDKEILTGLQKGEKHEVDLVVKVKYKGQDSHFLVHIEAQAESRSDFPKRIFKYFARLHEKYELPIYPIAVLSYASPLKNHEGTYQIRFSDFDVLAFQYRVVQLNRLHWQDFVRHENPVAAALMAKMNIAPAERPRVKLECLNLIARLKRNPAENRLLSQFVDTYLDLTAKEKKTYETLLNELDAEKKESIMEIETSWKREGIKEGIRQGRQEGRLEIVSRQLENCLGTLEAGLKEKLRELSPQEIDDLSIALLKFTSLEEFGDWLDTHRT